jgi:DNA polymerase-4
VFVSGEATILHADLDAFYASVEQRDDPRLLGRPVIVGAGVVLAASYEAKAFGVRTAMGGAQARALCPNAVVVEPRMSAYSEASEAVFEVFNHTTPLVEGLSIDEAFLDVGGLRRLSGAATEIAVQPGATSASRSACRSRSAWRGPSSWPRWRAPWASPTGCSSCLPAGSSRSCTRCPSSGSGGGARHRREASQPRITSVGEVSELGEGALVAMLGKAVGRHLHALAHNRDPRPVQIGRRRHSIGSQHALGRAPKSSDDIDAAVVALVDRVTGRMRAAGRVGRTVMLRLRFDDFSRATRSHTWPRRPRRPGRSSTRCASLATARR